MGSRKWESILVLLPEYFILGDTECLEFFSGTFYHGRGSTDIIFLIFCYSLWSKPVGDISRRVLCIEYLVFSRKIRDTREVLYIFKILKTLTEFQNLTLIKAIFEIAHSEYECDFFGFFSSHRVLESLAV